ncbi:MAG: hypothetical protein PHP20_07600 [Firmicutes bacterium]|jgi:hypothetical protein|nr:hypothetical protein [Bacillota bacterium]MDD4337520.1 hypothetical protein [Bacillota bacterium]MDD4792914.1 hypothetical protein [Bacillota bacterium]
MAHRSLERGARGRRTFAAVFAISCIFLVVVFMAVTAAGYKSSQLAGTVRPWCPLRVRPAEAGARGIVLEAFGRGVRIEIEPGLE